MKILLALAAFVAVTTSTVVVRNGRRYSPEEENPIPQRFMFIPDGEGNPHLVDLAIEPRITTVEKSNITLYLFNAENTDGEELSVENFDDLVNSQIYDPARKNVFICHGWLSSKDMPTNLRDIRETLFAIGANVNVFVIDWHDHAKLFYTESVVAVPQVGKILGGYINEMISHYGITPDDFVLIGHSLGGQVIGCIGAAVDGLVDQIISLDPARPLFTIEDIDSRVDETDGKTVHIIHTNGGFLGFLTSMGHADFYFNGGSKQAGCGGDALGVCSHMRAVDYYIESLISNGFKALNCPTHDDFLDGVCDGNAEVIFGQWPLDPTQHGDFQLNTNEAAPFALG